jgi:hypothetical protein
MTQKIQESMLDITFLSAFASIGYLCSWSISKKWQATMVVSAFTFISPVSSSMIAPASSQLAERFDIHSSVLIAMTVSVFVLAYGGNFYSHHRLPLLIARFHHRHHSLWALVPWPAQRNIWTLARFTACQLVVSRYMRSLTPAKQLTVPLSSLEYSVWFCKQQEYAYSVSLSSRTGRFSPTINRWRCHK